MPLEEIQPVEEQPQNKPKKDNRLHRTVALELLGFKRIIVLGDSSIIYQNDDGTRLCHEASYYEHGRQCWKQIDNHVSSMIEEE